MRIIIIGGGIGGLATAVMLHKNGFDVKVYEQSATFSPLGAGIGIGSNAMQALQEMGIEEEVMTNATPLTTQIFQDAKGHILNTIDFSLFKRKYGFENVTIHRADLHKALVNALPPKTIAYNRRCEHVSTHHNGVIAVFSDGISVKADVIIAADGIHSPIRQQLQDNSKPRYAGYTCWRGLAHNDGLIATNTSTEVWDASGRFGYAPLQDNTVYWFACVNSKANNTFYQQLTTEELAFHFKKFPQAVTQLIKKTAPQHVLHHDIYDIKPLRHFVYGRVVLIGDAAHATTPNMGQGAGQAIEDAVTLVNAIKRYPLRHALQKYEQARIKHTHKVTTLSRQIGWAAQWDSKSAIHFRNRVFPLIPSQLLFKRLQFLFERKW